MKEIIKELYDVLKLYSDEFYSDLLTYDFAIWTAVVTITIVTIAILLYYVVFDRVRYAKILIWCIYVCSTALLTGLLAYVFANNALIDVYEKANQIPPNYGLDYFFFALTNFLFSLLLFLVLSIPARNLSANSRLIPF